MRGEWDREKRVASTKGRAWAKGPACERSVSPPTHVDIPKIVDDREISVQDKEILVHFLVAPIQKGETLIQISSNAIQKVLNFLSGLARIKNMPTVPTVQHQSVQYVNAIVL